MGRLILRGSSAGGGGSLTDGGAAYIAGSGFGTNSATITAIKSGVEGAAAGTAVYNISGFSAAGWGNAETIETSGRQTEVSTSSPFYGTKCLICVNDGSTNGGLFGVKFNTGATVTDIFIRDYIRIDHTGSANAGQWKMIRFNSDGTVQDSAPANMYFADWFNTGFDFIIVNNTGFQYDGFEFGTDFATWYEREVRVVPGSQGVSNGVIEIRIRKTSDFTEVSNINRTNVLNYTTADRISHVVFYNYQGNNSFGDGSGTTTVRMDGTYISNGSQKRIYLGNASTWASCTQREIQVFTSWADGRIDFTVNKGWLSSLGTVYGYVADASGTINSSGYTVVPN